MRQLTCTIRIGRFEFNQVNSISISSSWKRLTDVATIVLPRQLKWKDKFLKDEIKRGDQVQIFLGYDYEENLEFSGYVSGLKNGVPVHVECEDEMWKLKQKSITQSWSNVNLTELVNAIAPGVSANALNAHLGAFRISRVSPAKVLEQLKRTYGFVSFFRGGKLVVGYPYSQLNAGQYNLVFERQVVSNRLNYQREDDVAIKVQAVSLLSGGGQVKKEVGPADGELHTLHFYNLDTTELENAAIEEAKRLNYEGYRGSLETFGAPFIQHSDSVILQSLEYPERDGEYLVDEVAVRFGQNGFRRRLKLGPKI